MPRYTLSLIGLEVTFSADAEQHRIEAAKKLVEDRFGELSKNGSNISKEKLLACLALGLADDYLVSVEGRNRLEARISELLEKANRGR
ncbi:MAG: cell division protein ZapA [Desulfovibrionaceae bacterium]|jgi:cell division protein ZapA